jgi:hypothetical protein
MLQDRGLAICRCKTGTLKRGDKRKAGRENRKLIKNKLPRINVMAEESFSTRKVESKPLANSQP